MEVAIPIPSGEGQNARRESFLLTEKSSMSQYLYLLVKVRTFEWCSSVRTANAGSRNTYTFWWRSELGNLLSKDWQSYWQVAIPIPSGEGQNFVHEKTDDVIRMDGSQYLYLLVKVRTKPLAFKSGSWEDVAIPIPSGEGQNRGHFGLPRGKRGRRNTYTFWWRSEHYYTHARFESCSISRNTYTFWWRSELPLF